MYKFIAFTIQNIKLNADVVILNLSPIEGDIFDFKPGQYAMLAIFDKNGKVWQSRPFSICSSPTNRDYLQFAIRIEGEFTKRLAALKNGDTVGVSLPQGFFTFNEHKMETTIFLAGGIGITPFMSTLRYVSDKSLQNKITLLYSNKTEESIIFLEELKQIQKENKNIKMIFTLTDNISNIWTGERGMIDNEMIVKYCHPFEEKFFSLCGPLGFMKAISTLLKQNGVKDEYLNMERFTR